MQPARAPARAPGSFSPLPSSNGSNNNSSNVKPSSSSPRPPPRRVESFSSDDTTPLNVVKARNNPTPIYASFTAQPNSSTHSLQQNFSRPTLSTAQAAARSVASAHSPSEALARPGMSPLAQNPPTTSPSVASFTAAAKGHSRKHSASAGLFDSTLPSTSTSNLSQVGSMAQPSPTIRPSGQRELSASAIAAQAAVMHHQNQQQAQQQYQQQHMQQQPHQQHNRQRSQTVPAPGAEYDNNLASNKRGSGGPLSPPLLSLTEASAPRESGFGHQGYHNGLLGSHTAAATAAANVVFPRSGQVSPKLPSQSQPQAPPPLVTTTSEKPVKAEKSKVKLFSRPGKIGIKGGDPKDKPLPSPGRSIGHALSSLQRGNFSTTSLDSTSQSFYSLANSSTATIKAVEAPVAEKEGKEKKHHFLSRQKNKLKDKDDYHLPLSSASSNSRPTDPNAPSSLYNFHLPPSPGPNSTFKSMSSLGHGGRSRDKKKDDKFDDTASSYAPSVDTSGAGSLPTVHGFGLEPLDGTKYGLNSMTADDSWPFLNAKLLVVFEGEDVRIPVEDMNNVVRLHIQFCIARRSPNIIVEDLRDLLHTGFGSLDQTLRKTSEERLIPSLVELWMFTFGTVLPYMQAVFLPLDMEFLGVGTLLSAEQARDFWGGVVSATTLAEKPATSTSGYGARNQPAPPPVAPISTVLEVRRMVLIAFRDIVILPRYDMLKSMMSRSALEFLPQSLASMALSSPVPVPSPGPHSTFGGPSSFNQPLSTSPSGESFHSFRPGTAHSLDPGMASYNSQATTLLPESSAGSIASRSRAISNVSFGSSNTAASREQNAEDSKEVTMMVARMLQCLSILASVGHQGGVQPDEGNRQVEELNKLLKLNWLGRGRTGRNRRGIVGGRGRRGTTENIREEEE
ncbi:HbrB-like protein [Coniochaeta ligniaria NRRL 30616]|uniref:HbrB-like protein n=1 Tax=Coniochaeta ligniaria NRRL 30616 TaxID=1408157 RepID=A0A1J7J9G7_9PEZI|nr:HbrB-like protein [Coniochaeta ligniaria NRRL 30616]